MLEEKSLPDIYHQMISTSIDEEGVFPHQMVCEDSDGHLGMYALMLHKSYEVYNSVRKALLEDRPRELIFGMDRFCKEGQGTTLGDCIAGAYWNGKIWRPFIIEYQNEPRVVKSIDWNNDFWNNGIQSELSIHNLHDNTTESVSAPGNAKR